MNRLFIIGSSSVIWPYPKMNHWVDLLKQHYDVTVFGKLGLSNIDIIQQIGLLPSFKEGDRLVVVLVSPRLPLFVWGKFDKPMMDSFDNLYKIISDKDRIPTIKKLYKEIDKEKLSIEYSFLKKQKELLKKYSPIFTTTHWDWADDLDFIEYEKFTSFDTETNGNLKDNHLGIEGNKDFYRFLLNRLDSSIVPQYEEKNKII